MKKVKIILLLLSVLHLGALTAQNDTVTKRGTITVKKQGHLSKIIFDDVNYRLLGVDNYGNVWDSAVVEFTLFTTIKGIAYKNSTTGPNLSTEMQHIIDKRDSSTVLFFRNIKAKDRSGTIITVPDFSYTFSFDGDREY